MLTAIYLQNITRPRRVDHLIQICHQGKHAIPSRSKLRSQTETVTPKESNVSSISFTKHNPTLKWSNISSGYASRETCNPSRSKLQSKNRNHDSEGVKCFIAIPFTKHNPTPKGRTFHPTKYLVKTFNPLGIASAITKARP